MKKVLLTLCAVGLLSLVACKKDSTDTDHPTPVTPPEPEVVSGDGVFNPAAKIAQVRLNGQLSQEWVWEDGLLQTILQADANGNLVENNWFDYDNSRLQSMVMLVQGMPVTVDYTYLNRYLQQADATSSGIHVVDIIVDHNTNNKINHLTFNVNNMLLNLLLQFMGSDFGGGFFSKGATSAMPSKLSVDSTSINMDLEWQGDNVARQIITADIDGSVTLGEVKQMINLDSLLGPTIGAVVAYLPDTTTLPLHVALSDTISMTYDNQHNPYYGFLGALQTTGLSANNVITSDRSGTALLTVSFVTPFGAMPFTLPYPLQGGSEVYSYTYNASGYPETVVDGEGGVTQYTYNQ